MVSDNSLQEWSELTFGRREPGNRQIATVTGPEFKLAGGGSGHRTGSRCESESNLEVVERASTENGRGRGRVWLLAGWKRWRRDVVAGRLRTNLSLGLGSFVLLASCDPCDRGGPREQKKQDTDLYLCLDNKVKAER